MMVGRCDPLPPADVGPTRLRLVRYDVYSKAVNVRGFCWALSQRGLGESGAAHSGRDEEMIDAAAPPFWRTRDEPCGPVRLAWFGCLITCWLVERPVRDIDVPGVLCTCTLSSFLSSCRDQCQCQSRNATQPYRLFIFALDTLIFFLFLLFLFLSIPYTMAGPGFLKPGKSSGCETARRVKFWS